MQRYVGLFCVIKGQVLLASLGAEWHSQREQLGWAGAGLCLEPGEGLSPMRDAAPQLWLCDGAGRCSVGHRGCAGRSVTGAGAAREGSVPPKAKRTRISLPQLQLMRDAAVHRI